MQRRRCPGGPRPWLPGNLTLGSWLSRLLPRWPIGQSRGYEPREFVIIQQCPRQITSQPVIFVFHPPHSWGLYILCIFAHAIIIICERVIAIIKKVLLSANIISYNFQQRLSFASVLTNEINTFFNYTTTTPVNNCRDTYSHIAIIVVVCVYVWSNR